MLSVGRYGDKEQFQETGGRSAGASQREEVRLRERKGFVHGFVFFK